MCLHGYLKLKYNIERVIYTDELFDYCKEIKEIPLTKTDIENSIKEIDNYIENDMVTVAGKTMHLKDIDMEYNLFTQEKLEEYFDESIKFIVEKLT